MSYKTEGGSTILYGKKFGIGVIMLLLIGVISGLVQTFTGMNIFVEPRDYLQTSKPDANGVVCASYQPHTQQLDECRYVANVGEPFAEKVRFGLMAVTFILVAIAAYGILWGLGKNLF